MFLGLDIGTSAVKAVLVDDEGLCVSVAEAPLTTSNPHPGWSEQDPEHWVNAVEACGSILAHKSARLWRGVSAIGLSGQMHGAVLLDQACQTIRPAILWNDSRSVTQCIEMNTAIEDVETRAGIFAMPGFTAPKILWCADEEPETYKRIAHLLLPKDYVRLALTGTLATDMSDAAGTMWLNQAGRCWDERLCDASKTNTAWLPKLLEGDEVSGHLTSSMAGRMGLRAGIPIVAGGGDAATGALGIGAIAEGDAFASLGTSGQLFVSTEAYRPALKSAVHCYAHCVPGRWFQMACMLNGASPMNWFSRFVNQPISKLLDEAERATGSVLFLPYLTGERTPHNDPDIRGAFYGLGPETDSGSAMRAIVEAIAYSFCDARDCLVKAGTDLETIGAIGGGSKSDFLLQTMADATGLIIQRLAGSHTGPAIGAARLSMMASGQHTREEVAKKPELVAEFRPCPQAADQHTEKLERWRTLYQTLRPFAAE